MFKFFREENDKFSSKVFVVVSLLSLFLLILLLILSTFYFSSRREVETKKSRYFLKEAINKDPFIVNSPSLENMLAGPIVSEDDPMVGDFNAPLVVAYYSDFDCEYCKNQEELIKKAIDKYRNDILFIWKDYPEADWSSISWKASVAARCAEEQGKFWKYHNLLYENYGKLSDELFLELAKKLELKEKVFKECLADREIHNLVKNNIREAQALDIVGVPFIYFNDKGFLGEMTESELEQIIKIELEK